MLRDRPDVPCGQAMERQASDAHASRDLAAARSARASMLEIARRTRLFISPAARSDLLFTMSENSRDRPIDANRFASGRAECPAGGARRDRTDDLLLAKQALSQLSYGPAARNTCQSRVERRELREVVGLGRLELPTSRLSSARSNQLSYKPKTRPSRENPTWRNGRRGARS